MSAATAAGNPVMFWFGFEGAAAALENAGGGTGTLLRSQRGYVSGYTAGRLRRTDEAFSDALDGTLLK